eukprot:scaffold6711_cov118-Isochrysis_galbana.AAC.5
MQPKRVAEAQSSAGLKQLRQCTEHVRPHILQLGGLDSSAPGAAMKALAPPCQLDPLNRGVDGGDGEAERGTADGPQG